MNQIREGSYGELGGSYSVVPLLEQIGRVATACRDTELNQTCGVVRPSLLRKRLGGRIPRDHVADAIVRHLPDEDIDLRYEVIQLYLHLFKLGLLALFELWIRGVIFSVCSVFQVFALALAFAFFKGRIFDSWLMVL